MRICDIILNYTRRVHVFIHSFQLMHCHSDRAQMCNNEKRFFKQLRSGKTDKGNVWCRRFISKDEELRKEIENRQKEL